MAVIFTNAHFGRQTSTERLGGSKDCCHVRVVQVFPCTAQTYPSNRHTPEGAGLTPKTLAQEQETSVASSKLLPL